MTQETKPKQKQPQPETMPRGQMASLAVQYIFNPDEKHLIDVSNISTGIAHSLTMLKAYHEQMDELVKEVKVRQEWYIKRYVRRKVDQEMWNLCCAFKQQELKKIADKLADMQDGHKEEEKTKLLNGMYVEMDKIVPIEWTKEKQQQEIDALKAKLEAEDVVNCDDLFLYDFLMSYCHVSRGRKAKLLEIGEVIADTDLQTRTQDQDDYTVPRRQ